MIRFPCTNCRQTLEMVPDHAGRQVRCAGCGQIVTVPAAALPVASPAPPPSVGTALFQLTCSRCGQWLEVDPDSFGKLVQCPRCGQSMTTPPKAIANPGRASSPATDPEGRLRIQGFVWPLAGGMLGVLFGTSFWVGPTESCGDVFRALIGVVLGGCVGAIFVAMWAFRLGAADRMGGWLVAGAIAGAVLGATLLVREPARPGALIGGLVGALLGTAAGYGGGQVWRRLDGD